MMIIICTATVTIVSKLLRTILIDTSEQNSQATPRTGAFKCRKHGEGRRLHPELRGRSPRQRSRMPGAPSMSSIANKIPPGANESAHRTLPGGLSFARGISSQRHKVPKTPRVLSFTPGISSTCQHRDPPQAKRGSPFPVKLSRELQHQLKR